jgi:hypothetical protein
MAEKGRDPTIVALESVYAALKDLDAGARKKVLSSAFALLGVEGAPAINVAPPQAAPLAQTSAGGRPVSLVELVKERDPGTNAQRIALFAYYREKHEGLARFSKDDLKPYFAKAKLPQAGNYDRDFGDAVRKAWIHEDGDESYLTSKGIEAIEAGFEGERKRRAGTSRKKVSPRKKRL